MIGIKVSISGIKDVQANLDRLQRDIRDKAVTASLNKVAEKAQTEIDRAIRDEYAVRRDDVRASMRISKAQRNRMEAVISIFGSPSRQGRSMNMIRFLGAVAGLKTRGATGVTKKQVTALGRQLGFKIKNRGGLKQIEGAFIGNKGRTVFMREGKERLPIKPVQVIGYGQMFNSRKISARVLARINRDLPIEVDRAIAAVIARQAK